MRELASVTNAVSKDNLEAKPAVPKDTVSAPEPGSEASASGGSTAGAGGGGY